MGDILIGKAIERVNCHIALPGLFISYCLANQNRCRTSTNTNLEECSRTRNTIDRFNDKVYL